MKKILLVTVALVAFCAGATAQTPDAKSIIRQSRQKCQSIQCGHYEMERRMKYMSDKDTTVERQYCHFKKVPTDTIFGKYFLMGNPDGSDWNSLYTGNELVDFNDGTGTNMPTAEWANEIIHSRRNYEFYEPLTEQSTFVLMSDELLAESNYTYDMQETTIDGRPCYQVVINGPTSDEPDANFGMKIIRNETTLWIDKEDYLQVRYSNAYDIVEGLDTMYQYEECRLLSFEPTVDESLLTLNAVPANVKLSNYVPYEAPKPLRKRSVAPDWALPTLSGDTLSLSDLRGKVVLIDFFYKSCAPCCAALPALQRLHEKYKDRGFVMVGIDPFDDPDEDAMADFLSKRGVNYTVAFADRELAETYHVSGYPTLFFVNRKGKIMQVYVGYSKDMEAEIERQLLKML